MRAIFILGRRKTHPLSLFPSLPVETQEPSCRSQQWLLYVNPLTPPSLAGSALTNDQTLLSLRTQPGRKATPSHHLLFLHHCHHPRGFKSPSEFRPHLYLDLIYTVSRHSYLHFACDKKDRGTQAQSVSCECHRKWGTQASQSSETLGVGHFILQCSAKKPKLLRHQPAMSKAAL